MLIQVLQATRRVFVGTSVAKGRCGVRTGAGCLAGAGSWSCFKQGPTPVELGGPVQSAQFRQPALEIGGGIFRIHTDLDVLFGLC